MEKINLRKYYPNYYKQDYFIEVSDDVYETLKKADRQEAAYSRRKRKYKAYYYFTDDNYIEYSALSLMFIPTPCEIYESTILKEHLYSAFLSLSEKQAHRIYARYFLNMSLRNRREEAKNS
ncbi:MAG: sigma-70 family RNA polymerase sigma factor [Clostridiales bacterium]|nr:sigma-70 family RNA polymerase sigma factor [Clostridiales bacterium]